MQVAVTAVGADRPGIAAAVTKILFEHRGNIEDSRMAILGGHFSMMLIVGLPDGADAGTIEQALQGPAKDLDLLVSVRPVAQQATTEAPAGAEEYVVSVYGADKPGIVFRVSETLARHDVNITDLATRVVEGDPVVYVVLMEVVVPRHADTAAIDADLKLVAGDLDVDVSFHPLEAETL
ncbi:MAG: glycine cleavage system protein R [Actinomycetota bacterium]